MPKVFISHSTADRELVEREIIAPLHEAGIETWYSKVDIRPTDVWERGIVNALEDCDWFLLAMSPSAVKSEWVRSELSWAMKHRFDRIVPVLIEECDPYDFHLHLDRIQHIDFRQERVQAKTALIRTFPGVAPSPKTATPPPIAPQPKPVTPPQARPAPPPLAPQPEWRVRSDRRGKASAPSTKPVAPPPMPPGRPPRRFMVVLAVAVGGFFALGITICVTTYVTTPMPLSADLAEASALGNPHIINSLEDSDKEIERAVGFVVCGRRILYSDGEVAETPEMTGSCFAVSPDGYFVTNRHVVEEADRRLWLTPEGRIKGYCQEHLDTIQAVRREFVDANQKVPPEVTDRLSRMEGYFENRANFQRIDAKIWVFFGSKSKMCEASIVYVSTLDICVLKVPDRTDGPYFSLAEEKEIPGRMTKVYALGFSSATGAATEEEALQATRKIRKSGRIQEEFPTSAFSFKLTEGIVRQTVPESFGQAIQHTARLNPGSSGGPLVTANAKVVGINTYNKPAEYATATFYALAIPRLTGEIMETIEMDRKKQSRLDEPRP